MLLLPISAAVPAETPKAVLKAPVLDKSAAAPTAVLPVPLVLNRSVPAPKPVLKLPSVLLKSEYQPTAVFPVPVVTFARAFCPSAVLKLGKAVSGAACAFGKSAKLKRISAMKNPEMLRGREMNVIDGFISLYLSC